MAFRRFRFLMKCLRLDDIRTRDECQRVDKLAAVRVVFEDIVENVQKYSFSQYTTIDEMLLGFRGRYSFRIFIPNKLDR